MLDRGKPHWARLTQDFLGKHRRPLFIEWFPAYAPELNPDEHVWTQLKYHELSNHGCFDTPALHRKLLNRSAKLRRKEHLLWGCIKATRLPFRRP